jgi:diguanylate cyclase (GGDEF)-like protein
MKIFQDKGKTLLPRVDSIFLLSRTLILLGAGWMFFTSDLNPGDSLLLGILNVAFLIQLLLSIYLVRVASIDLKKAYLSIVLFDLVLVSVLIRLSGGFESNMFLFYYLITAFTSYILIFRFAMIMVALISAVYVVIIYDSLQVSGTAVLVTRIGIMWYLSLAIAFVSDYVRRSENRLLKLFDTLNQRTAELEKSQANLEMIYENSRVLTGILDVNGVSKEVMRIIGELLTYPASALLLTGPGGNLIYRGRNISGHSNFHLKAADGDRNELIKRVAQQTEPVTVVNITGRNDYQPLRPSTKSVLLVPMIAHGKTIGVLLAESPKQGYFTSKDEKMVSVVARSAAMAIDNAMLHRKMEELTITDELTGIYNYRHFTQKLKEEQRRAERYNSPLSLIMLDVDWFKKFNDTYGHEVGNIVLKGMTGVIKKCIRDVDILARYGGEEFVVLLPQTPKVEVSRIGERIRQQIEASSFGGGDNLPELKVTVSIGVTSFPENARPYDELLATADQALYKAKNAGKNLVCVI